MVECFALAMVYLYALVGWGAVSCEVPVVIVLFEVFEAFEVFGVFEVGEETKWVQLCSMLVQEMED